MYKFKPEKLLKIAFVTTLIVLCVLIIWALLLFVMNLKIQWWGKVMILTAIVASIFIAVLIRKIIQKRREMKFIDGIVGPDEMPGNISALDDASRELRRRFKQAVATLRKSHLKHKGNPLYVLPWYLVVGRSGAGKSTAVKSARLASPFGDFNRVGGIEGTRNCDWWFFDKLVVIDIAGRYCVHRKEELDKNEWQAFLKHLVRYRKKEPINGVIVTVEADRLLEGKLEKIEEEGRIHRKRLDEITSVMGAKFPVYLLVTKSDLIYGIERYYRLLSESSVTQAMGLMNHDREKETSTFVNNTIDMITQKLKDIRLILVNDEKVVSRYYIEPEVLLFPNEFARLRNGLVAFCKGAFKENPFQESPYLRGIYFCSGRQEGRPVASIVGSLGSNRSPELSESGDGFFLNDFFAKILPSDRSLYSLTTTAKEWGRLTHSLWLTALVTIVLGFGILATYSWNENRSIIRSVSEKYQKAILFKDNPIDDIGIMVDFSHEIKAVEARNKDWKMPRLGLRASLELEKRLKQKYCRRFKEHFEADINEAIQSGIANGGWVRDDYAPAIKYIPFVVRRINMIKGKFDGADAEDLEKLPAPNFALILHGDESSTLEKEISDRYKTAYVNYLVWQDNTESLNATLMGSQRLLENYFHENKGDLRWLIGWAEKSMPEQAFTMNTFWRSESSDSAFPNISPAYTTDGRRRIGDFVLNELEIAVEQPLWTVKPKEQFLTYYKDGFYKSWIDFAFNFGNAKALFVRDPELWAATLERFVGDDSPYLALLETMEKQLLMVNDEKWPGLKTDTKHEQSTQQLLDHIKAFGMIRKATESAGLTENKQAANQASHSLSPRTKMAAKLVAAGIGESELAKGKHAYKTYQEALQNFSGITTSRKSAYAIAREGFEDEPGEEESALRTADKAIDKIRMALNSKISQKPDAKQDPFWYLLIEPVDELWRYAVQKAGDHLQYLWDKEVMVKTEGVRDSNKLVSLLFGDKGHADAFIGTHAAPFIERSSRRGYYSKSVRGCSIPFKKSYFSFIKQGKKWKNVAGEAGKTQAVTVTAYPTDVNIEARVKPHMTRLVLEDVKGNTTLVNKQYPIEKNFKWSPSESGDVTVEIMLGDITLKRRYTGHCSFGKFVREFKGGKRIFTVDDFPEYRHEFRRLGVDQIDVIYQFQADQIQPLLIQLDSTPKRLPTTIISGHNAKIG